MKKLYLFFALAIASQLYAQNKTLGVGTPTPNANAALHVESPTGNQGLLMPRLTTAQRTAMAALPLTTTDIGLMVYDTSVKALFIWNGTQWQSSAKLALPYVDTVLSAPAGSNLLRLLYTGSGATENVGVAQFENLNPNNGFSPLFARTNSITNGALDLVVNNTANTNDAIGVTTNGLGTAGRFVVNNATNPSAAIYASTNGTGGVNSAAIYAETATAFSAITAKVTGGTSNAISGISNSTDAGSYAILGQNTGPGPGGVFFSKSGTGLSGTTQSNIGGALAPVGVYGESTGTGSSAAAFRINNAGNNFSAVFGETNGLGAVFFGNQIGTGQAGTFKITNATSTASVVDAQTNGTGDAVFAKSNGASAGNFQNSNAANSASTLFAMTNAGGGHALGLINSAEGRALTIFQGGVQLSVFEITTGTSVVTRAAAYRITGGGPSYSLGFATVSGDSFMVYNDTASAVSFAGVSIPAGSGKIIINFSGSYRGI